MELADEILNMVAEEINVGVDDLDCTDEFEFDIALKDYIHLLHKIENRFNIIITIENATHINYIEDLVKLVSEKTSGRFSTFPPKKVKDRKTHCEKTSSCTDNIEVSKLITPHVLWLEERIYNLVQAIKDCHDSGKIGQPCVLGWAKELASLLDGELL